MSSTSAATSGATPDPGATPGAGTTPDSSSATRDDGQGDLGDSGRKALADVRRELRAITADRDEARRRITELEDAGRSELERKTGELERANARNVELEAENASLRLNDLKHEAAAGAGIPDLWKRLEGGTPEELAVDAKKLAERMGGATPPDLGAGARQGGSGGPPAMNELIRRRAGR